MKNWHVAKSVPACSYHTVVLQAQEHASHRHAAHALQPAVGYLQSKLYIRICEQCVPETSIPTVTLEQFSVLLIHHHETTTSYILTTQEVTQFPLHIRTLYYLCLAKQDINCYSRTTKTKIKPKPKVFSSLYKSKYFGSTRQISLVLTQPSKVTTDLEINTSVS